MGRIKIAVAVLMGRRSQIPGILDFWKSGGRDGQAADQRAVDLVPHSVHGDGIDPIPRRSFPGKFFKQARASDELTA
jgi:hypothetical protein